MTKSGVDMSQSVKTLLNLVGRLNWRLILIVTSCLIFLHFFLNPERFQDGHVKLALKLSEQANDPKNAAKHGDTNLADIAPSQKAEEIATYRFDDFPSSQKWHIDDNSGSEQQEQHPGSFSGAVPDDAIPQDEYVAICMSVKNQPLDLPEFFVHHYHHVGIRRFYIMDDGSEPPLSTMLDYGVPSTVLTFEYQDPTEWNGNHLRQLGIYARCIEHYGHLHTWMAFLDGDEFLATPGNETLKDILTSFEKDEKVGALGVNWRMHTSSGLLKRPTSARKSFTTCHWDDTEHENKDSDNVHIKSIVKTSKFAGAINPHKFSLKDGAETVGEHGDIIEHYAFRHPITRDRVALHHFAVKSREEYEAKLQRGNAMDDPKGEWFWEKMEVMWPHENCTEMTMYDP